ncbi:IS256 family transposase [Aerococcus urinaeequi]|uniref:IS256 family transposase n=1 Tax=Aerococcus urinaeequi TaxID=51665 RepID=UPI003AABFC53
MTRINLTIDAEKFLQEIMDSDLNTVTKGLVTTIFNHVMEVERDHYIQAEAYERTDDRKDQRNGYYERDYIIKPGRIKLKVPRTRSGEFSTELFEKYERMDQSLILAMAEMVINGQSTRSVNKVVQELLGENVSKSFVSKALDRIEPEIEAFCNRSLTYANFIYLFLDAMYINVIENHHSVKKAVYIAQGVRADGYRDIVVFWITDVESAQTWTAFLQSLKARGLTTPRMVISDAHTGLRKAIETEFLGTKWQRCVVHFMRNIIEKMPKKNSEQAREFLKRIFKSPTKQHAIEARDAFYQLVNEQPKYNDAVKILDNGFYDAIQYTSEPDIFQIHLRTTNSLERVNREIRRRERSISLFPNIRSAERLIGAVLLDIHEVNQSPKRKFLKNVQTLLTLKLE